MPLSRIPSDAYVQSLRTNTSAMSPSTMVSTARSQPLITCHTRAQLSGACNWCGQADALWKNLPTDPFHGLSSMCTLRTSRKRCKTDSVEGADWRANGRKESRA